MTGDDNAVEARTLLRWSALNAAGGSGRPPSDLHLLDLGRILWRRKAAIAGCMAACLGVAFAASALLLPVYVATALVLIDPDAPAGSAGAAPDVGTALDSGVVDSQVEVLRSRSLARAAAGHLDLADDPEIGTTKVAAVGWPLAVTRAWLGAVPEVEPAAGADEPAADSPRIERFLDRLKVERQGKSYVIAISYRAADPERAAAIANTVAESYLADQVSTKLAAATRAADWLDVKLAALKAQVSASERELERRRVDSRLDGVGSVEVDQGQITDLTRQLVQTRLEVDARDARLNTWRSLVPTGETAMPASALGGAPVLSTLLSQQVELVKREAQLRQQYGSRHPLILDLKAEQAVVQSRVALEQKRIMREFQSELDVAKRRAAALETALVETRQRAAMADRAKVELVGLERDVAASRSLYEAYLSRVKTGDDDAGLRRPDARIISAAVPPAQPNFPKPTLLVAVALVAGVLTALLAIYALEATDTSFRDAGAVAGELGLPMLAMVPEVPRLYWRRRQLHDDVLKRPNARPAESLRELLTNLVLAGDRDGLGRVVLMASTVPGEGKTSLALALGRMAAGEGMRAIVIDADLRRPSVEDRLGLDPGPGLGDLLTGELKLDEAIRADAASSLSAVPGSEGMLPPVRLLGEARMAELVEEARSRFDLVILDSAPLLAVADSRLLCRHADRVVLVIRWGTTPRDLVGQALSGLRALGAPLAGVVLSRVDLRRHATYGHADSGFVYARHRTYYAE